MENEDVEEYDVLASKIAMRFRKRASWVDVQELKQVAWLAFLDADQRFDPAVGVPRWKFLERAATYACTKEMYRSRSPVHAGNGSVKKLVDFRKVNPDNEPEPGNGSEDELLEAAYASERKATIVHSVRRVVARSAKVEVSMRGPGTLKRVNVARAVLLEGRKPKQLAAEYGVELKAVYEACRRARKEVGASQMLYKLSRDKLLR